MEQCQIDGIDELKIFHDVHNETNMKSIKNINIKKNTNESDHRTPKRKSDISNSNTSKKQKKYESALAAIFPENDQSYSQYAQDYAEGYMKKMRERLDAESFDLAIKLLASFGDADDSNINLLYQQITEVLTDKNEDLIYEFLGFLLPGQALSIGKFTDYLELTRIKEFIRKLQVCMKKQPTQVRKILDNLFHLSKSENITPLEVHTSMLPLLKSNPILVDCFFQLIPTEHPPESFFSDDNWEDLDIDQSINYGIDYEEIIPSDSEDHTLLNICHCVCHKFGDNIHCRSCGLKFFKGRIYFDTPEGLKLAKINFEGADPTVVQSKLDKTKENITVKKKNRKSLVKNSSPGSAEDIKGSTGTESEEDLIDLKPKKRQKSKVVQSLKLKFKKEESPKCKNDQDVNDTGKSIVHVTNEELNSSEMVFFCIPKVESSVKSLPKRKSKVDVNESIIQNECEVINRIDNFDNLNFTVFDNVSDINNDCTLIIKNDNNLSQEITTDMNFTPPTNTIDNEPKVDCTSEQHQIPNNIKIELNSQIVKDDFIEKYDPNRQTSSDESCKQLFKVEYVEDSETNNIGNIKQSDNLTLTKKSTAVCVLSSTAITDIDTSLLDKNKTTKSEVENLPESYVNVQKQDIEPGNQSLNKWVIDKDEMKSAIIENLPESYALHIQKQSNDVFENQLENKWTFGEDKIKSEVIENLSECYSDVQKQNIKPENQSTNKWIIDKDKIKSEIIENLPECYEHIQKQSNDVSEKQLENKWTFGKDKIKSEVIENLPECYSDVQKQDNNESEKQLTNKWTIDEDKIILQTCKRVEDIEVLLETINRRIPQRSVSEIQERFTTLMTLLEQMIDVKQN